MLILVCSKVLALLENGKDFLSNNSALDQISSHLENVKAPDYDGKLKGSSSHYISFQAATASCFSGRKPPCERTKRRFLPLRSRCRRRLGDLKRREKTVWFTLLSFPQKSFRGLFAYVALIILLRAKRSKLNENWNIWKVVILLHTWRMQNLSFVGQKTWTS